MASVATVKKIQEVVAASTERVPDPRNTIGRYIRRIGTQLGKDLDMTENGICAFAYETLTIVVEVPAGKGDGDPHNLQNFFIYSEVDRDLRDAGEDCNDEEVSRS